MPGSLTCRRRGTIHTVLRGTLVQTVLYAIQSLCDQSENLVYVGSNKADFFKVHAGLPRFFSVEFLWLGCFLDAF